MARLSQEELTLVIDSFSLDHITALESLFSVKLTDQQKQLVNLSNDQTARVAVASATGTGKTAILSMLTLLYLMIYPDCRILITSPSFSQLVRVFHAELLKWQRQLPVQFQELFKVTRERVDYLGSTKFMQFASLVTASVENKESLQGGHASTYVILVDEASGVSEEAFDILLATLSTGDGGRMVQVSNPVRSSGRFYQIFQSDKGRWNKLHFSAEDSPNVNPEWIEEMRETYGEDSDLFRMRVLGQFPRVGISQFISAESVEDAISNKIELISYHNYPKVMGVDIARFGDDKTVFIVRQGPKLIEIKTFRGLDTMEIASLVAEFQSIHNCTNIYIDSIGIGAGTYDRCKELTLPAVEVIVSNKSTDPNKYMNLRSQLWGHMKDWVNNGADLPFESRGEDSNLLAEMTSMEYFYNAKMQLQLMSKKDLKKAGHSSPDIADALSLTFAQGIFSMQSRTGMKRRIKKVRYAWA